MPWRPMAPYPGLPWPHAAVISCQDFHPIIRAQNSCVPFPGLSYCEWGRRPENQSKLLPSRGIGCLSLGNVTTQLKGSVCDANVKSSKCKFTSWSPLFPPNNRLTLLGLGLSSCFSHSSLNKSSSCLTVALFALSTLTNINISFKDLLTINYKVKM